MFSSQTDSKHLCDYQNTLEVENRCRITSKGLYFPHKICAERNVRVTELQSSQSADVTRGARAGGESDLMQQEMSLISSASALNDVMYF